MYAAPQSPRSIGGVMDDAIELFKVSLPATWGLALFYGLIAGGMGFWQQRRLLAAGPLDSADPFATFALYRSPSFLLTNLALIVLGTLIYLVITRVVLERAAGRPASRMGEHFGAALSRLPLTLVAAILYALGVAAGTLLLVIPGIYVAIRWMLWFVVILTEGGGPLGALRRSWRLMKGHWWRAFVILTVCFVLVAIIGAVVGMVFGAIGGALRLDQVTLLLGIQLSQVLVNVFTVPAIAAVMVSIYHDLKLRAEGGDLEARLGSASASA
jgi:hypothetical protein